MNKQNYAGGKHPVKKRPTGAIKRNRAWGLVKVHPRILWPKGRSSLKQKTGKKRDHSGKVPGYGPNPWEE